MTPQVTQLNNKHIINYTSLHYDKTVFPKVEHKVG